MPRLNAPGHALNSRRAWIESLLQVAKTDAHLLNKINLQRTIEGSVVAPRKVPYYRLEKSS